MACPICDHALQRLEGSPAWFWCPRCGTICHVPLPALPEMNACVPMLVTRCREFEKHHILLNSYKAAWRQTGIAESINLPEDRP